MEYYLEKMAWMSSWMSSCIHIHWVVHIDIKGANIFLTEEMKTIKLGDFGCAVKIKAHTTMPGELQGFVGTQAYMAPEVFTRNMNEGHGRAADIWSMACVVLEMVQGERPWADLKSNYQIMFKVVNTVDDKIRHTLNISGWNGPVTRSTRPSLRRGEGLLRNLFCSEPTRESYSTGSSQPQFHKGIAFYEKDIILHIFLLKIFEEDENQSLPLFASFSDFSEMRRSLVRKDSGKY